MNQSILDVVCSECANAGGSSHDCQLSLSSWMPETLEILSGNPAVHAII